MLPLQLTTKGCSTLASITSTTTCVYLKHLVLSTCNRSVDDDLKVSQPSSQQGLIAFSALHFRAISLAFNVWLRYNFKIQRYYDVDPMGKNIYMSSLFVEDVIRHYNLNRSW